MKERIMQAKRNESKGTGRRRKKGVISIWKSEEEEGRFILKER